ncbi:MAG TPA: replication-associated recombination protein A [Acidobacteriota bacterium]|nr:replication-associated recombination protein A [Acidobacteriota bacterium]
MSDSLFPDMKQPREEGRAGGSGPRASAAEKGAAPLADRMRPGSLEEMLGQEHLLGQGKVLRRLIEEDQVSSMILWGPPGVGKTTLARLVARHSKAYFVSLSAVLSGVKDIKQVVEQARRMTAAGRRTVLFIDELHRFNKAQQDALLPHVESGALTLIGATTENPSFEVIAPLLSRSRVFVLRPLEEEDILKLLHRALQDEERGLGKWAMEVEEDVLSRIASFAEGDARQALNSLEVACRLARSSGQSPPRLTAKLLAEALQNRHLRYDKSGEEHYNIISALHKSMRNSDPDASLYWLGRMLEAGEDPRYILRRMIRFAAEDVGLADPDAVGRAVDALRAYDFVGLPEGKLFLAQTAVYLAKAPKSNAVYKAYGAVEKDVRETRSEPVPLHLRNAPTRLMKDLGYGQGYRYAHDEGGRVEEMNCLPEKLKDRRYWEED